MVTLGLVMFTSLADAKDLTYVDLINRLLDLEYPTTLRRRFNAPKKLSKSRLYID